MKKHEIGPWIGAAEVAPLIAKAVKHERGGPDFPPFICDYILSDVYTLSNGDKVYCYFQEFGFLWGAQIARAAA